jgi:shikimate dehydrogenase
MASDASSGSKTHGDTNGGQAAPRDATADAKPQSAALSGRTRLLGLIADPVAQARSPMLVNALLERRGAFGDFAMLPLQVASAGLAEAVAGLRHVASFAGAIVSMPHKEAIVPLLDGLGPEAQRVGAVNVVRRHDDGRLTGTTLDGEGFVAGLRHAGHRIDGRSFLLVGAGGAGAAIAFALARHRCASLRIENRTRPRAEFLAMRVRDAFPHADVRVGHEPGTRYDVAINATSLGMAAGDPLPMSDAMIDAAALIAECVVAMDVTPLLATAQARGKAVHRGVAMLEAQLELLLDFMGVAPSDAHPSRA